MVEVQLRSWFYGCSRARAQKEGDSHRRQDAKL